MSLGLVPFDNTKVRKVFDTTKYFSKIISVYLLFRLYSDCCRVVLIYMAVYLWVVVLFILYLCCR